MSAATKEQRIERAALWVQHQSASRRYREWIDAGNSPDDAASRQLFNRAERAREKYQQAMRSGE